MSALKTRIRNAQLRASLAVNQELILLYWQIGREILQGQQEEGWGAKVIDRLAKDLKREFSEMKGFSRSNLKYMRTFAEAYPPGEIGQQLTDQNLGQMSFYVTVVDNLLRGDRDDPTIGIILCKSKDRTTVEYALQGSHLPIGVSSYQLQSKLPPALENSLPTVEQLEIALNTAAAEIEATLEDS